MNSWDVTLAVPPVHRAPTEPLKPEKYWWVEHTPEGETAFNNQCVNPECGFQGNERQSDLLVDGKWKASRSTPIYCAECGELLPRPRS